MKFESTTRRLVAFSLYLAMTLGAVSPGFAQQRGRPDNNPRTLQRGANGAPGAVPFKRASMVGEGGRRIPADIPVRAFGGNKSPLTEEALKALAAGKTPDKGRIQVGGPNGANVLEQVVSITFAGVGNNPDDRTPFWSSDETAVFFASNRGSGRFNLFRAFANLSQNPLVDAAPVRLTANTGDQFDYLFPTLDTGRTRIAFLRSSDSNPIDSAAKRFDLYVAPLSGNGNIPESGAGLISLTAGRTVVTGLGGDGQPIRTPIVNVRRAAWLGNTTLVFAAQLQGKNNYDLFQVDITSSNILQLTDSDADEQNPAVSPDGSFIAFDADANVFRSGANEGYVAGNPRSIGAPTATPASAARNNSGVRAIFTIPSSGVGQPRQFSGRLDGGQLDANVSDVQPTWSSQNQSAFLNPGGAGGRRLLLAWSSNRRAVTDPGDPTGTTITRFDLGNSNDVFYAVQNNDSNQPDNALVEGAIGSGNAAKRLDTNDPAGVYNDLYPSWAPAITIFRIAIQSNRTGTQLKDAYPAGGGWTAGANDILIASVLDITAPTLLRYNGGSSTGEIVHINLGSQYQPGNGVDLIRRREDGVLPGTNLFFTVRVEDRESGLRPDKAVYLQFKNPNSKYQSAAQGGAGVEHKDFNSTAFAIADSVTGGFVDVPLLNTTTGRVLGAEFECQAISALDRSTYYSHRTSVNAPLAPLYLAGVNDQFAFTGQNFPPLDGDNGTQDVWLELKPLVGADGQPIRPEDGQGGVYYGATWQLPTEASDWYIDVILYDNAVNPFNPNQRSNWIIYDNVWGFSSALPISGPTTDILFVSDYTLGQKFFLSRFSAEGATNLPNLFFGAESYLTDIDVSLFPSYTQPATALPAPGSTDARRWDQTGPFLVTVPAPGGQAQGGFSQGIPNALGVNSYMDSLLESGATVVDGKFLAPTSRYSIWRILSRGPVPKQLLDSYLPEQTTAPHDIAVASDPLAEEPNTSTSPRRVLNANRMVIWSSPFTGNLFVGDGNIADIDTQNDLSDFVTRGGRLLVTGQDIGFALAGNGQANNFYTNTLGATYVSDFLLGNLPGQRTIVPVGPAANPYNGQITDEVWGAFVEDRFAYGRFNGTQWAYEPLGTLRLNNYSTTAGDRRGDGSPAASPDRGFPDVIGAAAGARIEYNYGGGGGAMVSKYTEVAGFKSLPAYVTMGKGMTAYAAFGIEGVSQDWYTYGSNPTVIASLGKRTALLQNIISAFRTGTLTGQLIDDNGSPVTDALVRAVPAVGLENEPAVGTAITDRNGNFTMVGLPPESYTIYGYKAGFYTQHTGGNLVHGGWRTPFSLALKRANPGRLTGITDANNTQLPTGGVFKSDGVTPIDGVVEIQARRVNANGTETVVRVLTSDGNDENNDQQAQQFPGVQISTGPRGAYQFPNLLIDRYRVIANPTTLGTGEDGNPIPNPAQGEGGTLRTDLSQNVRVTLDPQPTFRLGPGTTVVDPGASDNDPNTPPDPRVEIRENQTAQIDFLLAGAPQGVTGRVVRADDNNQGIANATVSAFLSTAPNTPVATGTTDAQGNYTLLRPEGQDPRNLLDEGTYIIRASAPGFATAEQTVQVGGNTQVPLVVNFALEALPPGSVSGLVLGVGGSEAAGSGATVRLFPVLNGTVSETATITVTTGNAQTEGGYRFNWRATGVPAGEYVATVTKRGFSAAPAVSAQFTVTPNQETRNINFTLEPPTVYSRGIQLISTPLDYSNVDARTIFGITGRDADNNGDGTVNDADRQLFDQFGVRYWLPLEERYEPRTNLEIGRGYFINLADSVPVTNVEGTPFQGDSVQIPLANGWNLIGHPFGSPDDASDRTGQLDLFVHARVITPTDPTPLTWQEAIDRGFVRGVAFAYSGSLSGSQYIQTSILSRWRGYWLRSTARDAGGNPINITLVLNRPGATGRSVKQLVDAAKKGETSGVTRMRSISSRDQGDWRLQLAARQGDLIDSDNSIGVAPGAKDGFDLKFDTEKPPMMDPSRAPQVYLALDGKNETGRSAPFADDVRTGGGRTARSWEFTVRASGEGNVTVYWPNASRLPRGVEPVLTDLTTGRRVPVGVGGTSSYTFTPENKEATRRFKIEVARPSSVPLAITNVRQNKVIGRGPNNPGGVRFTFTVTREADVVAEIQSLAGRTVQRLQTRAVASTETSVLWNGRTQEGRALPVGPYVLTLSARDGEGKTTRVRLPLVSLQ